MEPEVIVFVDDNEMIDLHDKACFLAEKSESGELDITNFIYAHFNVLPLLIPEPISTVNIFHAILLFRHIFKKIGLLDWVLTGDIHTGNMHKVERIVPKRIPEYCGNEFRIIFRVDPK